MTLENIVCILEQGKYLQENGLFQDSLFVWAESLGDNGLATFRVFPRKFLPASVEGRACIEYYPAPTAEELLEVLPIRLDETYASSNLTHSLANMYIYLHKNNLLG